MDVLAWSLTTFPRSQTSSSSSGPGPCPCAHRTDPDPCHFIQHPPVLDSGLIPTPQVSNCMAAFQGWCPQGGKKGLSGSASAKTILGSWDSRCDSASMAQMGSAELWMSTRLKASGRPSSHEGGELRRSGWGWSAGQWL